MVVTEMLVISYDLTWFSSLKNSHILLLVEIIVHIDDVIKIADIIKKYFFVGFFGLFLVLLNYLMFFGDDDNVHCYLQFLFQHVIKHT